MDEYIAREALAVEFMYADADVVEDYGNGECEWGFSRKRIQEVINGVPSADVFPVRHGRWVYYSTTMQECSNCQRHTARHKFKYCPHCGAIMEDSDA